MARIRGKYEKRAEAVSSGWQFLLLPLFFFLTELFAYLHLRTETTDLWPLVFGLFWAVLLSGALYLLPAAAGRILFGILFGGSMVYSVGQTGYYLLFSEMMWLSEFRYAGEGAGYWDVIFQYPASWFLGIGILLVLGGRILFRYPGGEKNWISRLLAGILAVFAALGAVRMPGIVFLEDEDIRYAGSDYGRAQSAEAAYENMFNPHRLYQVCGLFQSAAKDIYTNGIYPMTSGYAREQEETRERIDAWFDRREETADNAMTGVFRGKNVIIVLMESMDDWMLGEHTPTINRLMEEGINFTRFYTPPYGGIRTFNTEFCINTGTYLSSRGGYAFDYVTNTYSQSLPALLTAEGYSARMFHYNDPGFYSRGVFSEALGYEKYVCYADSLRQFNARTIKQLLYDDQLLFDNGELNREFFREGSPTFNFVITRSAHLSYKYNEVLSNWGLAKYPQYRGLTGHEEMDCAYLKARLVDDFFARLLEELELHGQRENTVIIGVTDHYTYGIKDEAMVMTQSGAEHKLLLERTPCFIWAAGAEAMEIDSTLHTADLLPTILNLLGIRTEYRYMGYDAFTEDPERFVPFSDGSWITDDAACAAGSGRLLYLTEDAAPADDIFRVKMSEKVGEFTAINNLILDADYYG